MIKDLYQQILGIPKPWSVTDVGLKLDGGKIEARVSAVARQMDLRWDAIDEIMQRAVARGLKRRDDTGLYPNLDVDETAFRKRHDDVTVVSYPGTGAVIHLCDDRKRSRA